MTKRKELNEEEKKYIHPLILVRRAIRLCGDCDGIIQREKLETILQYQLSLEEHHGYDDMGNVSESKVAGLIFNLENHKPPYLEIGSNDIRSLLGLSKHGKDLLKRAEKERISIYDG